MRVAVVGHVEWVEFLPVDRSPEPGAILRAPGSWSEPAGGGGVAAAELARLAGRSTLFTALGNDAIGQAIPGCFEPLNVKLSAQWREEPHRRAITLVDPQNERTITVVGPPQAPKGSLDLSSFDAVYFCKGDVAALQAARAARVLVATARVLPLLREAGVHLDALVRSSRDPSEFYRTGDLHPSPRLVAETNGRAGGTWSTAEAFGSWKASPPRGPVIDTYGAGDSFAAGLTFALGKGMSTREAVELAARSGAAAVCRRGAHGGSAPADQE